MSSKINRIRMRVTLDAVRGAWYNKVAVEKRDIMRYPKKHGSCAAIVRADRKKYIISKET